MKSLHKIKGAYFIIAIIQIALAAIAFIGIRRAPLEKLFCSNGDGLKNYFTLQSFVSPRSNGTDMFFYKVMNYPFGEYIYSLDNTPIFAQVFKFFCLHVADVSAYTLPIYNVFILLNFVLAAVFCLKIFRLLNIHDGIAMLFITCLSWSNMQVIRISRGHFNLSLSVLIVVSILLLIYFLQSQSNRKRIRYALSLVGVVVLGSFMHGYYLPILGFFIGGVIFFALFYQKPYRDKLNYFFYSMAIPLLSLVICIGILRFTDGFFNIEFLIKLVMIGCGIRYVFGHYLHRPIITDFRLSHSKTYEEIMTRRTWDTWATLQAMAYSFSCLLVLFLRNTEY